MFEIGGKLFSLGGAVKKKKTVKEEGDERPVDTSAGREFFTKNF
jgi:hypothetical protein